MVTLIDKEYIVKRLIKYNTKTKYNNSENAINKTTTRAQRWSGGGTAGGKGGGTGGYPTLPPRLLAVLPVAQYSGTKKAPKLNFLGKFCRQKSLLKFWPMGGQKKV